MTETAMNQIRLCTELPTLPAVALSVLELTQRDDTGVADIARAVQTDPAISSKLLKTVNSSFYGRSTPVSNLNNAVVVLGMQTVKTLVLGFSLVPTLRGIETSGINLTAFWRRAVYGATAAKRLSQRMGIIQQEEAFCAALLADLGMIVLGKTHVGKYGGVVRAASWHDDLAVAEREALGCDHAQVAGFLAEEWKFPPVLALPIQHHHDPETIDDPTVRQLAQAVQMAGWCADILLDQSAVDALDMLHAALEEHLSLDQDQIDDLLADIASATGEVAKLFEVRLDPQRKVDEILARAREALDALT